MALREEHVRLLRAREDALEAHWAVQQLHKAEDEERTHALKVAVREGREPKELPDSTPPEARATAIRETWEVYQAATAALADFVRDAFAMVRERADEWNADLDADVAKASAKREEARRLLAEAEAEEAAPARMRDWIGRHVNGPDGLGPIGWDDLSGPKPSEPMEDVFARVLAGDGEVIDVGA